MFARTHTDVHTEHHSATPRTLEQRDTSTVQPALAAGWSAVTCRQLPFLLLLLTCATVQCAQMLNSPLEVYWQQGC